MASGKTDTYENAIINHFLRTTSQTATSAYLALYSVAPGESTSGTELTVANGYAREAALLGAPSAGVSTNGTAVTFSATGAWSAIVGHALCDASTAGNILMYEDSVSGPTLADGDSYEFGIGDITVTET